jgi:hypothetical protein
MKFEIKFVDFELILQFELYNHVMDSCSSSTSNDTSFMTAGAVQDISIPKKSDYEELGLDSSSTQIVDIISPNGWDDTSSYVHARFSR